MNVFHSFETLVDLIFHLILSLFKFRRISRGCRRRTPFFFVKIKSLKCIIHYSNTKNSLKYKMYYTFLLTQKTLPNRTSSNDRMLTNKMDHACTNNKGEPNKIFLALRFKRA